jgi:predicted nucleotidyltransferase
LDSSVLRWPDFREVDEAVRNWAAEIAEERADVIRIGYFGSYARGDWGVGSDLDVVIILDETNEPVERRNLPFDTRPLPVPTDVLVYTREEWDSLTKRPGFQRTIQNEAEWICEREDQTNGKR